MSTLRPIGEVAQLLGVSVRTLHYWEERGLITPAQRTWSDYRLYSDDDIARLQQVMVYRATGMSLDGIARVLDSGDRSQHLRRQKALLMGKLTELQIMIEAIDTLLEEPTMNVDDIAQILGDANFPAHHSEAEEKYGDTEEWAISQASAKKRTPQDWEKLRADTDALEARLADAMTRGVEPGSAEANTLAEEHRSWISQHFPTDHAKQVLIARGYVADDRFRAHYDNRAPGLAQWLKNIIDANATAHQVNPDEAEWE